MHTLIWVDRHDSRRGENIDCMYWFLGVYKLDIVRAYRASKNYVKKPERASREGAI